VISPVEVLNETPFGSLPLIANVKTFEAVAVTLETAVPFVKVNGLPE
jgi:hypothetical protein